MQGLKRNGCVSIRTETGYKGHKISTKPAEQAVRNMDYKAILKALDVDVLQ